MNEVPNFQPGEVTPVIAYAEQALGRLAERIRLSADDATTFERLFMRSMIANAARIESSINAPYVPALTESRELLDFLGTIIVGEESRLIGADNLRSALAFMTTGGNVLLVQNHTSGADTLVMDRLVNDEFSGVAKDWLYMSGHAVNLFLLPLTITGALHRIQIFSTKYCVQADEAVRSSMRTHNARSLATIAPIIMDGGKLIGLYPEGGRGEGALLPGEPRTMKIPQLMASVSPKGLMVLPTYVRDATSILPVVRGDNEFNEVLEHLRRGNASIEFGPGVMWSDIQPGPTELQGFINGRCCRETTPDQALKRYLVDRVMGLIDAMATGAQ
ncbi:MAG: 1-acyl-sn-glycerol-3-phosphate acyltransferase [Patescibacteria group bacterium]